MVRGYSCSPKIPLGFGAMWAILAEPKPDENDILLKNLVTFIKWVREQKMTYINLVTSRCV